MRAWFERFVFGDDAAAAGDHLPPHARGPFGPAAPERDAATRDYLKRTLDRATRDA